MGAYEAKHQKAPSVPLICLGTQTLNQCNILIGLQIIGSPVQCWVYADKSHDPLNEPLSSNMPAMPLFTSANGWRQHTRTLQQLIQLTPRGWM